MEIRKHITDIIQEEFQKLKEITIQLHDQNLNSAKS